LRHALELIGAILPLITAEQSRGDHGRLGTPRPPRHGPGGRSGHLGGLAMPGRRLSYFPGEPRSRSPAIARRRDGTRLGGPVLASAFPGVPLLRLKKSMPRTLRPLIDSAKPSMVTEDLLREEGYGYEKLRELAAAASGDGWHRW
jgi:hypothetical protein